MFLPGRKVTYAPYEGAPANKHEKGIIKKSQEQGNGLFVVFNCDGDWDNFQEYTSKLCNPDNLYAGW